MRVCGSGASTYSLHTVFFPELHIREGLPSRALLWISAEDKGVLESIPQTTYRIITDIKSLVQLLSKLLLW